MMKKVGNGSGVVSMASVLVVMVVVLGVQQRAVVGQGRYCDPLEMSPCIPAIAGTGNNPTPECCTKLAEQAPCFCSFLDNPAFDPYRKSPNTIKVLNACHVIPPLC